MKNEYPFLYAVIIGTSAVFIAILLVFQNQQDKKLSSLKEQVKQASAVTSTTEPPASVNMLPRANENPAPANENRNPTTTASAPERDAQNDESPDRHIEQDRKKIADLNLRLSSLEQTAASIRDRASTAEKQQQASVANQNVEIDRQIASVSLSMRTVDQRLDALIGQANANPPESLLQELRSQRLALQNQLEQLNLQKRQASASKQTSDSQISTAATNERDRLRLEQEDIRKQIAEAQADLENWQKRRADQGRVLQAQ